MSSRRQEERAWQTDAHYEAWRRGVPENRVSYDRMSDAFQSGQSPEEFVSGIRRQMQDAREAAEMAAAQEAYEIEQSQINYMAEGEGN